MIEDVRARIEAACMRSGRDPADVELVAVSKGRSTAELRDRLLAKGQRLLGESRVQEWRDKAEALNKELPGQGLPGQGLRWHLIGHLQTNKVRFCRDFELLHAVDSPRLVEALEAEGAKDGHVFPILLQTNVSGEHSKHGAAIHDLPDLVRLVEGCAHLRLEGLMTIAPFHADPERSRPVFRELRALADRHAGGRTSMGMSQDFEVAVEEGASWLRVGSALFSEAAANSGRVQTRVPGAATVSGSEVKA